MQDECLRHVGEQHSGAGVVVVRRAGGDLRLHHAEQREDLIAGVSAAGRGCDVEQPSQAQGPRAFLLIAAAEPGCPYERDAATA